MQDRPNAVELLDAIANLLEGEVLPAVEGRLQHQVRVAGNLCRILAREAELGAGHEVAERALLAAALAEDGRGRDALALTRELAERLAGPPDAELQRRAWHALDRIVRGKLAIVKPGHDAYDFSSELD